MAEKIFRIGVMGASSLAGKEVSDELAESVLAAANVVLLDDEETAGQMTAAGDEAAFIQRTDATSFDGMDFLFFAGEPESTKEHWQAAKKAGASLIDLTYALEGEPEVLVRAPWVQEALGGEAAARPDLKTPAVIAAHPAAVMLALVAARLEKKLGVAHVAATVMEPASEHRRAAMDELHQQTVNLLSFHNLPKEQYDAQVSFNLLPALGESAKVKLDRTEGRIRKHYEILSAGRLPEFSLQLIQAPVFHGYVTSVLVELKEAATVEEVEAALAGEHVDVLTGDSDPPSNLSAAGQEDVMVRVTSASAGGAGAEAGKGRRFWLWMAADNLKLAALNGIACAVELRKLRPTGKVQ